MISCKICIEKDKEIADRDNQIARILSSYKRDKKIGLITIGVLTLELILTLAYGKDGILLGIDIVKGLLK